jgi:hypothetical protein
VLLVQLFRRPVLLTLAAALLSASADAPAQVKGKNLPKNGSNDPLLLLQEAVEAKQLLTQLMNSFDRCDRNRDDHLDLREMAYMFRYATPMVLSAAETESSPKAVDESKYVSRNDYQFLKKVDQNSDRRVSKEEYLDYAQDYVDDYLEARRRLRRR